MPTVARVLAGFQRDQLASFIEVAIGLLDLATPDPDLEDATDVEDDFALSPAQLHFAAKGAGCEIGDPGDAAAYVEWDKMRGAQKGGHNLTAGQEDDEDSDPDRSLDEGEPDFARHKGEGAGCSISDPDYGVDDERHDEPDMDLEREQMLGDVPMLPVVTLDHNMFTDQRQPLGLSNLQSSFRCGPDGVRSADSGAVFVPRRDGCDLRAKPGVPV